MDKYTDIANILVSDKAKLDAILSNIELAHRSAQTYLDNSANERGLSIDDDIVWFALVDGLIAENYAFEVDWKEDAYTVCSGIEAILEHLNVKEVELDVVDEDMDAEDVFIKANGLIMKTDFVLINMDIDSDSYVSTLCLKKDFEKLKTLDDRFKVYEMNTI